MTDKITLSTVGSLQDTTTAGTAINNNFNTIQVAFDNTLFRDGTSPNQMKNNLDMNSNQILNLSAPSTVNSPVRLIDVMANPTITVPPVGTSGATVPLLNANNTFSGNNTFTGSNTFSGSLTFSQIGLFWNNTRAAETSNYTVLNTDKFFTIALGGSSFFTLTFNAPSGYDSNFAVLVVNEDTSRAKSIALSGGNTFMLYPGSSVWVYNTNNVWRVEGSLTWTISSPLTVYIDPVNGNDNNDGLAPTTGAFATHVKAMQVVSQNFIINTNLTIQWADGVYTNLPFTALPYRGTGVIYLQGNTNSSTSVQFNQTAATNAIMSFQYVNGTWNVQGFYFTSTQAINGLFVQGGGFVVNYQNMNFGTISGGFHVTCISGGTANSSGVYVISGGAYAHLASLDGGLLHATTGPVTITGNPNFTGSFCYAHGAGAIIGVTPSIFTGTATGARWSADQLSLIDTGAPSALPGNSNGIPAANTLSNSGAYVD